MGADEVEREKNQAYEMNIERAEKVVEEIVLKAEKVMDQVQEKLNKSDTTKASTESLTEFSKITQESKEVVQKLEESYIKVKEEEKSSISVSGDSFQRIEQESKEIVSKLNESYQKEEHISTIETADKVRSEEENELTDSKDDRKSSIGTGQKLKDQSTPMQGDRKSSVASTQGDRKSSVSSVNDERKSSIVQEITEASVVKQERKASSASIHEENKAPAANVSVQEDGKESPDNED